MPNVKYWGPRAASKDKWRPIVSLSAQCYRTVPVYCLLLTLTSYVYYVSFLANSRSSKLRFWETRNTEYISTKLHENKTTIPATMRLTACACILLKDKLRRLMTFPAISNSRHNWWLRWWGLCVRARYPLPILTHCLSYTSQLLSSNVHDRLLLHV